MSEAKDLLNYENVIEQENEYLKKRRKKLFSEDLKSDQLRKTKFGIALSGGGIRSATVNMGILKTFNKFGILKRQERRFLTRTR